MEPEGLGRVQREVRATRERIDVDMYAMLKNVKSQDSYLLCC